MVHSHLCLFALLHPRLSSLTIKIPSQAAGYYSVVRTGLVGIAVLYLKPIVIDLAINQAKVRGGNLPEIRVQAGRAQWS